VGAVDVAEHVEVTPRPTDAGDAAVRTALTRFSFASVDSPLIGRCEPTTTTGIPTFSVNPRK